MSLYEYEGYSEPNRSDQTGVGVAMGDIFTDPVAMQVLLNPGYAQDWKAATGSLPGARGGGGGGGAPIGGSATSRAAQSVAATGSSYGTGPGWSPVFTPDLGGAGAKIGAAIKAGMFGTSLARGRGGSGGSEDMALDMPPEIKALIEMQMRRQQRRDLFTDPGLAEMYGMATPEGAVPLQGAIAQLAYSLLPDSARVGLTMPTPTAPTTDPGQLPFAPGARPRRGPME